MLCGADSQATRSVNRAVQETWKFFLDLNGRVMLKQHWRTVARIERMGDILVIAISFFGAYYGRSSLLHWNELFGWGITFAGPGLAPIAEYLVVLVLAFIFYLFTLQAMGAYGSMRLRSSWELLRLSIFSSLLVFFAISASLFILKLDLSRSFILLFCLLTALLLTLERYLTLEFLRFWRKRGRNFRNIIISGVGAQAEQLAVEISDRPELGLRIRGFADLREQCSENSQSESFRRNLEARGYAHPVKFISGVEALKRALENYAIDEVIFTDVVEVMPEVKEMLLVCAEQGVRTTLAADLFSMGMVQSQMSYFGDMPLIHFQTPPGDRWELVVKRVMDIVLSLVGLIVLSPLLLLIALFIKLTSPGPVLFVQRRVGQNGRIFDLYKFRSMVPDAEGQLAELQEQNEMEGPVFKMSDDPRVTPLGRFLRRFSLDELPQLWNVLRGDMSLVGPRPPVPGEVSLYERKDRRRLSMRPGLTCTWQVSGRNNIKDFESWVKMDLEYIDNWSLGRDVELLFRTIPAVFLGDGAR